MRWDELESGLPFQGRELNRRIAAIVRGLIEPGISYEDERVLNKFAAACGNCGQLVPRYVRGDVREVPMRCGRPPTGRRGLGSRLAQEAMSRDRGGCQGGASGSRRCGARRHGDQGQGVAGVSIQSVPAQQVMLCDICHFCQRQRTPRSRPTAPRTSRTARTNDPTALPRSVLATLRGLDPSPTVHHHQPPCAKREYQSNEP